MLTLVPAHCIEYNRDRNHWKNSAFLVGSYWAPCKAFPKGAFERCSGHNTLEAGLKGAQAAYDLYNKSHVMTAKDMGVQGEIVLLQRDPSASGSYKPESLPWKSSNINLQSSPSSVQLKPQPKSELNLVMTFNGRRNNLTRVDYSVGDGITVTISHGKARRKDFSGKSIWKYILTTTAKWDKLPKSEFWLTSEDGETVLSGSFGGGEEPKDLDARVEEKMIKALIALREQEAYKAAVRDKRQNS